jgi:hypothetical protein
MNAAVAGWDNQEQDPETNHEAAVQRGPDEVDRLGGGERVNGLDLRNNAKSTMHGEIASGLAKRRC